MSPVVDLVELVNEEVQKSGRMSLGYLVLVLRGAELNLSALVVVDSGIRLPDCQEGRMHVFNVDISAATHRLAWYLENVSSRQ